MNNKLLQLKFKQRLNKLASFDYDNIEDWQILEAFNKELIEWTRRQIVGTNIRKEGDDASIRRIDDLQFLLKSSRLRGVNNDVYFETDLLPEDFLEFKRTTGWAVIPECEKDIRIIARLAEEANVDELLVDPNSRPSLEWAETFCTLINNRIRIYGGHELHLTRADVIYYRLPRPIEFEGVINLYTLETSTEDVECEFKDDIVELIIDGAAAILAGDFENFNQASRLKQTSETNN